MLFIALLIFQAIAFKLSKDGQFIDDQQALRIFHGVELPLPPETSNFTALFNSSKFKSISELGLNLVRIPIYFSLGMPKKGEVNESYFHEVEKLIKLAEKEKLSVIVVAKQHLLSKRFCGFGFPDWAISHQNFTNALKANFKYDNAGYPLSEECAKGDHFSYYTSEVGRNMENLFQNVDQLTELFATFWKKFVEVVKSQPNIVGYDLLNQPSSGNYARSKYDFLWPGHANKYLLTPFYRTVAAEIRLVDRERLIFYQPSSFDVLSAGFSGCIGNCSKEVFSYQIKCGVLEYTTSLCSLGSNWMMNAKLQTAGRLKIGSFLSELGQFKLPKDGSLRVLESLLQEADINFESWTYTSLEDLMLQEQLSNLVVRPYASKICATKLLTQQYDAGKGLYKLSYRPARECDTEVFVPFGFEEQCTRCQLKSIKDHLYGIKARQAADVVELIIIKKKY